MCNICGDCTIKVEKMGALPFEVLDSICDLCAEHEWILFEEESVPSFFVTIIYFLELKQFLVSTEFHNGMIALKPSVEVSEGVYCWCEKE